jgi:general secretion pathway protein A
MYLGFYKLKEMPFRLAPDPRFIYRSGGHIAARNCVAAARASPSGCAIITGERGAGKTALLEYLRQQVQPRATVRLDFPPRTLSELAERLQLSDETGSTGAERAILCDNAHLFHEPMLAAILRRDSIPVEFASSTLLVLSGEPALLRTLDSPELALPGVLHGERFQLPLLTTREVSAYIAYRLGVAGAAGRKIFSDEACNEVHRETRGNPRLINALCDAALMLACERELPEIGANEIRRSLEDVARLIAAQSLEPQPGEAHAAPAETFAPARPGVFARLQVIHGDRLVIERELPSGRLSIGRCTDNDLCIESKFVSRYHCRIVTSERKCLLEDVHSTNGLYVNDRRVRHHCMRDGDVVKIGEHRLHYRNLRDLTDGV